MADYIKFKDDRTDDELLSDTILKLEKEIDKGNVKHVNMNFYGFSTDEVKKKIALSFWGCAFLLTSAYGFGYINIVDVFPYRWYLLLIGIILLIIMGFNLKKENRLKSFKMP